MKKFAQNLMELRTRKGLTVDQLAAALDLPSTTIIGWENGKLNVKASHIIRLSRFFNISCDMIIGLKDMPPYIDL